MQLPATAILSEIWSKQYGPLKCTISTIINRTSVPYLFNMPEGDTVPYRVLVGSKHWFPTYRLRIVAVNIAGQSGPSQPSLWFDTIQAPPASPPQEVTVRAVNETALRVRWTVSTLLYSFVVLKNSYGVQLVHSQVAINRQDYSSTNWLLINLLILFIAAPVTRPVAWIRQRLPHPSEGDCGWHVGQNYPHRWWECKQLHYHGWVTSRFRLR